MSKIDVPPHPAVRSFQFDGLTWELFACPLDRHSSPLWIHFKLLVRGARRRWGDRRVYRLCWGVDVRRLRRGQEHLLLETKRPALYEAVVRFLQAEYSIDRVERELGGPIALAAERAKIASASERAKMERALKRAFS
jgi:hypothetical protein